MQKNIKLSLVAISLTLASSAVMAEDSIKLRAGFSNNTYTLLNGSGNTFAEAPITSTNLGLTFLTSDTGYIDISTSSGSADATKQINPVTYNVDRSDFAIVIGSNTVQSSGNVTNIYVGYKSGATTLLSPETTSYFSQKIDFEAAGLVLGGGVAIPMNFGGAFTLAGGVGLMSGDYTIENIGNNDATTYTADYTFGFSYGIGYTYPINDKVGVTVDYKGSSYTYTYDAGLTSEFELVEKLSGFGVSLYAKF